MSAEEILALLQVIARQQQQIIELENALRKAQPAAPHQAVSDSHASTQG